MGFFFLFLQLRLYDDRTQRKPVVSFEWSNHPSTCISAVPSADKQVIVGNSYGRLTSFDLKKVKQSPLTAYKGFIGAVRSVTVSEKSPLVLSISLDRFLRVHHLETGNIIYKVGLFLLQVSTALQTYTTPVTGVYCSLFINFARGKVAGKWIV